MILIEIMLTSFKYFFGADILVLTENWCLVFSYNLITYVFKELLTPFNIQRKLTLSF